jgi:GNAT superfamily N-acetyltransferase
MDVKSRRVAGLSATVLGHRCLLRGRYVGGNRWTRGGRRTTVTTVTLRREILCGAGRLDATTAVLQRARLADPPGNRWEAADVQWWWRRPRPTDELALPVWFDGDGPVAAGGVTAWGRSWQLDVFSAPRVGGGPIDEEEIWSATLGAVAGHPCEELQVLTLGGDSPLVGLAVSSGFEPAEVSGTTWMPAHARPPVATVEGFTVIERSDRLGRPHPMIARNGEAVEERLRQTSLYDPALDLSVEDADGTVAGYALFWFDPVTLVGLVEPMRIEDRFWRRGLARTLLSTGLDRLAQKGATRLKVGFESDAARSLYLSAGFTQTSVDRLYIRGAPRQQTA